MTGRRQAILIFYLTLGAFWVAHFINALVSQALTQPVVPQAKVLHPRTGAAPLQSFASLADEILRADLFATIRPVGGAPLDGPLAPVVNDKPLDASKKVKLAGTVLGEGVGALAILEDLREKKQLLYHLHERIPDIGEIVAVRRDGILLREGQQQEFLPLAFPGMPAPPAGGLPPVPGRTPVEKTATGARMTLDRRLVSQSVEDVPKLLAQAQAVPFYNEGKLEGWRIESMKPGSFYEQVGLQKGDVLQRINGVEVRDPGTMLTLFQQVKNEREVRVDLLRNNQRTTLAYEIR